LHGAKIEVVCRFLFTVIEVLINRQIATSLINGKPKTENPKPKTLNP
jgi:hypothetical protein